MKKIICWFMGHKFTRFEFTMEEYHEKVNSGKLVELRMVCDRCGELV